MDIVSAIRRSLVDEIGQDRFDVWFGSADSIRLERDTLTVAAPSAFVVERIRSQFERILRDIATHLLGREMVVEYHINKDAAAGEPESQEKPASPSDSSRHDKSPSQQGSNPSANRRKFAALDSFVVGETNRVAFTAVQSVVNRPGMMTPLVIHGPTGSGKSHLLEGIWSATRKAAPRRRIVFLSAEQFTSYFLEALQGSGLPSFRRKYREVELLVIDDVQFFAGKRATMIELQHTIDSLLREGRQIVLSVDRPPAELTRLGPELVARMSGGLVCGLEHADEETRKGILRHLAESRQIEVPEPVLDLIAAELPGDARLLSGALNRLHASQMALRQPITMSMAESALADVFQNARRTIHMTDIEKAVCDIFGLESRALKSNKKTNAVTRPRMLAMWLARRYTRAAYSEIGEYFGHRSHSTVISAQKKVKTWVTDGAEIHLAGGDCKVEDAIKRVEMRLRTG